MNTQSVNPMQRPREMQPRGSSVTSGMSTLVVIIIILALLLLGGWYYVSQFPGTGEAPAATVEDLQNSSDPDIQALLTQNSSDELESIEADVNATNLGAVDAAVADFEASMQEQ